MEADASLSGGLHKLRTRDPDGLLRDLDGSAAARTGLGIWFSPPADSFEQAAFIAGSALATISLSGIEAYGPAHWVLIAAGICGLAGPSLSASMGNIVDLLSISPGQFQEGVMAVHDHWQMDASAPELYERYLVPAITSVWADDLLDRIEPAKGESVIDVAYDGSMTYKQHWL